MNVLSLYNGISCGRVGFERANIPVEKYISYEIDEYANKVAKDNYPDDEYLGDVFEADFKQYESNIDIVIGGSPCTYWSIAQKNNRETEASGLGWELFMQYVRAIKEAKPKYFLYENNYSMSKDIRASIDKEFGFEAIMINSALVSAQNRKRLYWVGKRNENGTYDRVKIEQPKDKKILLKDILETRIDLTCNSKSYTLTASYNGACAWNTIERSQRNMVAEPVCVAQRGRYSDTGNRSIKSDGIIEQFYEAREDGKTNVLTTVQKDNNIAEPVILNIPHGFNKGGIKRGKSPTLTANGDWQHNNYACEPIRVGALPRPNGDLSTSQSMGIHSENGKSVCLTANGGGMGAKTGLYAIRIENGKETKYPIYEVKNGYITIKDKQYPIKLQDGYYIIRKLTVNECCRLQTLPDNYCKVVSDTRAYKGLGNGWTVDVIVHLLEAIKENKIVKKKNKLF